MENERPDRTHSAEPTTPAANLEEVLPMAPPADPEVLAQEKRHLAELETKPFVRRLSGYLKLSGPGFIQSALTLGGGSGSSSLFAGALAGTVLLWVQPTAMFFGVIMMAALAYMTLSTRQRPFQAVNKHTHPVVGWSWALATLISNFLWATAQFAVASTIIGDMVTEAAGYQPDYAVDLGRRILGSGMPEMAAAGGFFGLVACFILALLTLWVAWHYGRGTAGVRWFESAMKLLIAGIVICFAVVVFITNTNWSRVFDGFFGFHFPARHEIDQLDVVISMFATAVGINMTFLFPYTLLSRGWGREHRTLAGYDLGLGMLLPFALATSFLIISSSNTLHDDFVNTIAAIQEDPALTPEQKAEAIGATKSEMRSPLKMSESLVPLLGKQTAHIVFGLGFLGMTMSTVVTMMLVSGFTLSEIIGGKHARLIYRIGLIIPAFAMFGPILFGALKMWVVVPVSVFCFFFMPIAYITFFYMMNNRAFLGDDVPRGWKRWLWNIGMICAIVAVTGGGGYRIYVMLS